MTNIVRRTLLGDTSGDLISDFEWGLRGFPNLQWRPAEDIMQTEDKTIVKMDLPGIKREDLQIEFQDQLLTVSGHRQSESSSRYGGLQRFERTSGSFSRSFRVPDGIEANQVIANLEDGVLELQIPKAERTRPVEIPVGETLELESSDVTIEEPKKKAISSGKKSSKK